MRRRIANAVAALRGKAGNTFVDPRSLGEGDRVSRALAAREALSSDFAGGWEVEDIGLLRKYATSAPPAAGMITDFLGIKTRPDFLPWASSLAGSVISDLPVPDDGLRAETIEYTAFLTSLEAAPRDTFTMAELGASYAPWLCLGAVLAKRSSRRRLNLTALEASSYFVGLMKQHLQDNAVDLDDHIRLVHGALAVAPGMMQFPVVGSAWENGGQAVASQVARDYVGREVRHEQVRAYTIDEVLPHQPIDFLHVDVQGAEGDVIPASVDFLNRYVRGLFVGTHSRAIEGRLLETLHANGWRLVRERPTKFEYRSDLPSIVGWTARDGGQFWMNPRV